MKSSPIQRCLLFLFALPLFTLAQTNKSQPPGSGTAGDPYLISSLAHLSWLSQTNSVWGSTYFSQTADIDASETQYWDDSDDNSDGDLYNDPNDLTSDGNNEGFFPIGNNSTRFEGIYNGQGHVIDGLFIDRPVTDYVGFIGKSNGSDSSILELGITNCNVIGKEEVGTLVGSSSHDIIRCYATGTVEGDRYVGGLIGQSHRSIENSFSRASVSCPDEVGGLVGQSTRDIENSFSMGTVSGSSFVGGLVGLQTNVSTDCFWDTQTSGQGASFGSEIGKSTIEMQQQTTFTNWDFSTVWKIDGINNDGYPYLQWQQFDPEVSTLAVSDLTATSVTVNGAMENLGNPQATEHGLQLAEDVDFTDQGTIVLGEPLTTGNFVAGFSELDQNTTYYVRAFVKDAFDVLYYGETVEFTTLIDITAPTPSLQNVPAVVDGSFTLELVFDEEVKDLSPSPITVAPDVNGLLMATLGDLVTVTEGFSYTIEVTPTIEGELRFNENVGVARDLAGNESNPLAEVTVIYDISAPVLEVLRLSSNNAGSASLARAGDEVYLDFESNEPLSEAIGNINGTVVIFSNVEDNLWRGTLPITENSLEGDVGFELFVADLYDHGLFVENTLDGSTVTVDVTAPTSICQSVTVTLDESGNATIAAEDIDDESFDNNSISNIAIDSTTFSCEDLGENTVDLTVTDAAGNSSSCSAVVTVVDSTLPIVLTTDITIELDANATIQITAEDIDNGSSDNCGIVTLELDIDSFTADSLGANTVSLTATDSSGNSTVDTATVTVFVLDDDGDGVPNFEDNCPESPTGVPVDETGCEIPVLEINNFQVEMLTASCVKGTDGALTISATNTDYEYEVSFDGLETFGLNSSKGYSTIIENLAAGSYVVCFSVAGFPQTEVCTSTIITEPEPLLVTSSFNNESGALELSLSGSSEYLISLNNEDFSVEANTFSTVLSETLTNLTVRTYQECQGVYEEALVISEEIIYGPNPTDGMLDIYIPGTDTQVKIAVHNFSGNMVLLADYEVTPNRVLELDLGLLSTGTYMISIRGETVEEDFKIVRL